jgi:methyl-accepting chemotaxis protein
MKNVRLAVKIGGGFGVLILIFLALGAVNGWFMLDIKEGAQKLNSEYIPEVRLIENFNEDYAGARVAFSKYIFTFEDKYYEAGMQSLKDSRDSLKEVRKLAEKFEDLTALRNNEKSISKGLNNYVASMKQVNNLAKKADELNSEMDESAASVDENISSFLNMHREHVQQERDMAGLQEVFWMQEVRDVLNSIRVANFKSGARNDMSYARNALQMFDTAYAKLGQIEERVREKESLSQLKIVREGLDSYKQAMLGLLDTREKVQGELDKLVTIGQRLLDETATVSKKGMERTVEVGRDNVSIVNTAILVFAGGLVLALILGGMFATVLTLSITRPIYKGVQFARSMAKGDYSQQLDIEQKDEVGTLARALNEMVDSNSQIFKDISNGVETLASSSTELNTISGDMAKRSEDTASKANTVSTAAEEMSSNMNSVAAAMEQASTNVSTVASSSEEMSSTISEIAENSEKAKSITNDAVQKSQETSKRVNELGNAASEISKVTESITAISSQTNLLALNATIEAARAGEAGKGFAVVANEIKELAQQTASATDEIKGRIQAIQDATGMTVSEIEEISQVINDIDSIISTIAAAVEEQSTTTRDIAENVGQAASGIQEVNENVSQSSTVASEIAQDIAEVNNSAGEMSNSSAQVRQSADELSKLSEKLKTLVARFKVN